MPLSIRQSAPLAVLLLSLTACAEADPATQEVVNPAPGLYEISLSGGGLAQFAPTKSEPEASVCVTEFDSETFGDRVARNSFTVHPGCTSSPRAREGNAIAGTISCPLDPSRAQGKWNIDYSGTISADGVEVTGNMSIDATPVAGSMSAEERRELAVGQAVMENIPIIATARRVSDCP